MWMLYSKVEAEKGAGSGLNDWRSPVYVTREKSVVFISFYPVMTF